jgi:hypothetical protein
VPLLRPTALLDPLPSALPSSAQKKKKKKKNDRVVAAVATAVVEDAAAIATDVARAVRPVEYGGGAGDGDDDSEDLFAMVQQYSRKRPRGASSTASRLDAFLADRRSVTS